MEKKLRYTIQHLGDSVVDLIDIAVETAKDSAAGVADSIQSVKVKRNCKKVVMRIGERAVVMRSNNPEIFDDDEEITGIFKDYDTLKDSLEVFMKNREARKARNKERFNFDKCCSCSETAEAEGGSEGLSSAPA